MKKLKILIIVVLFSNTLLFSQFSKGEFTISAGTSLFNYGYFNSIWVWGNDYKFSLIPPIVVKAEVGIHEYLGIGIFAGAISRSYVYKTNSNFKHKYNYYSLGGFGSFHFTKLLADNMDIDDLDELDMYVTSTLRIEQRNYSSTYYYDDKLNQFVSYDNSDTDLKWGFGFGMRYYFVENLALFAEAGTNNLGYFTLGGTIRF